MARYGKTREQHILDGTYRPARHEKPTIGQYLTNPQPTYELDEYGLEVFYSIVGELNEKAILRSEDLILYTNLGALASIIRDMYLQLKKDGYTATGSTGNDVPAPAFVMFMKAQKDLADLAMKLGVGPAARIRLHLQDRPQTDEKPRVDLN